MLSCECSGSISARLAACVSPGGLSSQPLQLHLEPPDLLVEIGLQRFLFPLLPRRACTEDAASFPEQLVLSLTDLAGVQLVLAC